jgi:hypothetical protein
MENLLTNPVRSWTQENLPSVADSLNISPELAWQLLTLVHRERPNMLGEVGSLFPEALIVMGMQKLDTSAKQRLRDQWILTMGIYMQHMRHGMLWHDSNSY